MKCVELLYLFGAALTCIPGTVSSQINLDTKIGSVIGISENVEFNGEIKNVTRFLGIPYAKPPVREMRFARPEPYGEFGLPYNATYFRPHCMQSERVNPSVKYFQMSEDCLHLNIFIPGYNLSTEQKYAVMIFIHGGSFTFGGAEVFSGDKLSAFNDVVVVTVNYRLNTFGFLSNGTTSSGNMGLWDQNLAIQWVQDNIADFSGDPGNVTLVGNSAGAVSALYQALYPRNKGLFQRVIAQSGSVLAQWAQQYNPEEMFADFVSEVNCNMEKNDDVLQCLLSKPANVLVTSRFSPVVDGDFIKEDPFITFSEARVDNLSPLGLLTEVDFLSGVQSKEAADMVVRLANSFKTLDISKGVPRKVFENQLIPAMYLQMYGSTVPEVLVQAIIHQYTDWSEPDDSEIIRDKLVDLWSDVLFVVPAINVINKHQELRKSTKSSYFYVFDHKAPFDPAPIWLKGARHTMELPYEFGFPDSMKIAAGFSPDYQMVIPPDDVELSDKVMKMWTNFAKTGNPNTPVQIEVQDVPTWPQYDVSSQPYLEFSSNMTPKSVKNHFAGARVEFWTNLVPWLEQCETCVDQNCIENQHSSLAHSISKSTCHLAAFLLIVQMMFTYMRILC